MMPDSWNAQGMHTIPVPAIAFQLENTVVTEPCLPSESLPSKPISQNSAGIKCSGTVKKSSYFPDSLIEYVLSAL